MNQSAATPLSVIAPPVQTLPSGRTLASIQKIVALEPIPGYDRVEYATILGWHVIVVKGAFKPGDLCVYVECDSILPEYPEFEFLRRKQFRIRTIKMCKVLSQGIAFSLQDLAPYLGTNLYAEGDDVTARLGITKYDPEAEEEKRSAKGMRPTPQGNKYLMKLGWYRWLYFKLHPRNAKGGFPTGIKKTDETRIQKMTALLKAYGKYHFYVSEKLDGQSATYFVRKVKSWLPWATTYQFGVCSREIYLRTPHNCTWWNIAKQLDLNTLLATAAQTLGHDLCIQGEIVGPNIQKNKYKLKEHRFYVFNVLNLTTQTYYTIEEATQFCQTYGLTMVPMLTLDYALPLDPDGDVSKTIDAVLTYADGISVLANVSREGVVLRTTTNVLGGREPISFKAVSNKFLLEHGL